MLNESFSKPLVTTISIERATRVLLDSPWLDESYLFRTMGLRRDQSVEFSEIYWRMLPADRPVFSPYFDVRWYLSRYADVAAIDADAFLHFCRYGFSERRQPSPFIDLNYIAFKHPDLFVGDEGALNIRNLLDLNSTDPSPYVSLEFVAKLHPEANNDPGGPLRYFLAERGGDESSACPYFDPRFYAERYSDAPREAKGALAHFIALGDAQGRFPSSRFDPEWYIREYPDVFAAKIPPLLHFLMWGKEEGRRPVGPQTVSAQSLSETRARQSETVADFQPDLSGARERYVAVRELVRERSRSRKSAVVERDARPVKLMDLDEAIGKLKFKKFKAPRVSIIIPFYNEIRLTLECLYSILESGISCTFEVIVADDCSPDPDSAKIKKIPGIELIRQPRNVNFLRNCNAAFRKARGDYVLLLNNDAQLGPGAVDKLVAVLDSDPAIGAAGPKILYPNGRLQEAGCAVDRSGDTVMVGVAEDPLDPAYNYSRDVHHISGAALMLRRSLARAELFDEQFAPAYCEDLDLCLDIRSKGYRIRYVADAEVVHHLSITMADHGKKIRNIRKNQERIVSKWGSVLDKESEVRVISFYLPQFHPIPENDLWWGRGFTEWTNVTRALPSYEGHYQPHLPADLGFYDLRLKEVYQQQSALLKRYDLGGVCLYYYNFGGVPFLSTPLNVILSNPDLEMPFCLCWANENWSRRWDGGTRDLLLEQLYDPQTLRMVAQDVARAARDPRYIRVNGKALFLIYRPLMIPDTAATAEYFRSVAKGMDVDLHLVFVESMESIDSDARPLELGFDASVEFPPQGIGVPMPADRAVLKNGWRGLRYDYEKTVPAAIYRPGVPWPRYPTVFPSWDNTARQPLMGTSFDNASPEAFQVYVEEKLEKCKSMFVGSERLLFVNAWNEWAEGTHLEPDRAYGHRWLEAIRNALLERGCA